MTKTSIGIIIFAGCILTLPILFSGAPYQGDDAVTHARWYIYFSEQFWSGELYPRWLVGMNSGLGSPVFFYYPPVPYFLTSLLRPLIPNDPFGWYQLGVSASVAMILSGFCAYLWLKQVVNENSALITAVLYMATPYHLASDLYIRFSFAEFWSFVWLPLILYFTHKILEGNRLALVGFAISYALLIMTHLPTTLIFSVIPLIYAFVLKTDQKLKSFRKIVVSMALGIGLSANYLYPAMSTQQYVFLDRMGVGYFSYENWLFFSNFSLWTEDKFLILLLLFDLLGIAVCAFVVSRNNSDKTFRKLRLFWFFLTIGGVLMTTELSKPVWLIFYPLQKIQFPYRFSVILTLATTALIALAVSSLKNGEFSKLVAIKAIAFLLIAAWIPASVWAARGGFELQDIDRKSIDNKVKQSRDAPEYRPRWSESMKEIDWETSRDIDNWDTQMEKEYDGLLQRVGVTKDGVSTVKIVEGTGQIGVISWKSREIVLHAKADSGMKIYVSQFYFPNWTAYIEPEQQDLIVQPSQPDGLLSLTIPKGAYEVRLLLNKSREEFTGQIISLISLLCILTYVSSIGFNKLSPRKPKLCRQ